jgi:hypothetical protein
MNTETLKNKFPDMSPDVLKLNSPDALGGLPVASPEKKGNKYGAVKTEANGRRFDSGREAARAQELELLQKAREIYCLCYQVRIEVAENITYVADFCYMDKTFKVVCEDVKSEFTRKLPTYRMKRKLFKSKYGFDIKET